MGFFTELFSDPVGSLTDVFTGSGGGGSNPGSVVDQAVADEITGAAREQILPPKSTRPAVVAAGTKIFQPGQTRGFNLRPLNDPSGSQADSAGALTKSIGRAPTLGLQRQQQVSGQDIGRLLQRSNQFEATTGREVTGKLTEGLSRAAFGEAADRAAQNKSLALDEFRTELSAFGLDADTQLKTASTILNAQGADRQFALAQFASDLRSKGFGADQAFRLAQQSIDVQIQNEQNQITREGIAAGLSINQANARAQGIGTLLNLGVTALSFRSQQGSGDSGGSELF